MKRRDFLKTAGLGAAAFGWADLLPFGQHSKEKYRPNMVFVMADDHAAHALSCYGSKINTTPNLDRIAHEGMRLDNCFATNSLCAPSRASILTGKYGHMNGVYHNKVQFDGTQQTFPKLLQQAGYQTAIVGKWHLRTEPTGFNYWNVLPGQGHYHDPEMIEMGQTKKLDGYVTDIITDLSIEFLRKAQNDRPFCLLVHHKAPHSRWFPDDKHATMYEDRYIPEPVTFYDNHEGRASAAALAVMGIEDLDDSQTKGPPPAGLGPDELKRWKYQRFIKDYLRVIASIDENVGRVLDYLDESGLAQDTVMIYTSDQGFFLGDHGWEDKRFMYEESIRMPFLVRYPREVRRCAVNDDMVLNVDFAPTFLDFARAPIPQDMQGRSIRPLLKGKSPRRWRKSIYYHYYEYPRWHNVYPHYGVRTRRYKLIHYYYELDEWELFDLKEDPHEMNNLYDDRNYARVVKKLKAELDRLRKELKEFPPPPDAYA